MAEENVEEKDELTELEQEVIGMFVRIAGALSLPRSLGELYGLLFVSPVPLCIDDCMRKLKISKGSTSQGLKILRSFRAVTTVYVPGDRKDFFVAEDQLRKVVTGFANEQIRPRLEEGQARLARVDQLIAQEQDADRRAFFALRMGRLRGWRKRAGSLLPVILNFIKPE